MTNATIPRTALGTPIDVRPLLAPMRDALVELMTDRDPRDWDVRTTPGWTVADTIGHLLGDDLGRLSRTRDRHRLGRGAGESAPAFVDRINQEWAVAVRRLSPRVVLELLAPTGKQVRALWAGVDLEGDGDGVWWAGVDPAPVWLDMARDYTEYWVHQTQVREALGEPLLDDERFLEPVVATMLRSLPHALSALTPVEGTATLAIEVSDLTPGDWSLTADADGWRFVTAVGRVDTRVRWAADTLWRVGSRMIEPAQARARAQVDGEVEVGAAVCGLLAVIRDGPVT